MLELTLSLLVPALIAWIITGLTIRYAPAMRLVHQPNDRSSHKRVTPHGGGIGIVISATLFTLWLIWQRDVNIPVYSAAIFLAITVAAKGLLDDLFHLPPWIRLIIQFMACTALLAVLHTLPINGLEPISGLPSWLSFLLILIAGVWWLNLFNFMDGIDGLAASQAIFMLIGATTLIAIKNPDFTQTTVWIWMICLAAAIIGFLPHNWSPAHIFMGDTGSMFLSFMILLLALLTISLEWMNYATWSILGAVFITDASVTLLKRALSSEKISEAHCKHTYQTLAKYYKSHAKVTLLITIINLLWLLPIAGLTLSYSEQSYLWLIIAYLPLLLTVLVLPKFGISP